MRCVVKAAKDAGYIPKDQVIPDFNLKDDRRPLEQRARYSRKPASSATVIGKDAPPPAGVPKTVPDQTVHSK